MSPEAKLQKKEYQAKYRAANKAGRPEKQRAFYAANKDRLNEKRRLSNAENHDALREKRRAAKLAKKFGLSPEEFWEMLDLQKSACAICSRALILRSGGIAVDHNHQTGVVRALLCAQCNFGLGHFKESPDLMRLAIDYLARRNPPGNSAILANATKNELAAA